MLSFFNSDVFVRLFYTVFLVSFSQTLGIKRKRKITAVIAYVYLSLGINIIF